MLKHISTAAAALVMAASANAAVTVTSSANGPDVLPANMNIIYDFDNPSRTPTTGPGGQLQGDYGIVSGSSNGKYAAPLGDISKYLTVPLAQVPGTASLELGKGYKDLSFYWGSIDQYNSVSFFSGDKFLGTIGSADVPGATGNGSQGTGANNRRVNFSFGGDYADTIVISSRQYAFELDTIATTGAVPEPATWAMLIVGMGMVGGSLRRRRAVVSVAA